MAIELRNESKNEFTDISTEAYRCYVWPDGSQVLITNPEWLHVSKSGGHRILDRDETSHYIPSGWIHLSWQVDDGAPHFVK